MTGENVPSIVVTFWLKTVATTHRDAAKKTTVTSKEKRY